jgi:hypothetical protein
LEASKETEIPPGLEVGAVQHPIRGLIRGVDRVVLIDRSLAKRDAHLRDSMLQELASTAEEIHDAVHRLLDAARAGYRDTYAD